MVAGKVSLAVEFDLRQRVYGHLQSLELGFFDSQQTGQLMSRATVDLQSIRFFLGYGLIFLTQSFLTIALASVAMFVIKPWLAALALLPVPFVVVAARRYSRLSRPAVQEVQQRIAELTAEAEESISGVRIVKAFAREDHMLKRFRHSVSRVFDQNVYSTRLRAFYSPMLAFIPSLGLAVVLYLGGHPGDQPEPQPGRFHDLLSVPDDADGPDARPRHRARHGSARRRLGQPAVRDPRPRAGDRQRHRRRPSCHPAPARSSFATSPCATRAPSPRLTGVDLEVGAGRTVALVGPTGSGKTSLVALIARLYDTTEGEVLVDGADVRSVEVESLRRQIAFVADDPFLFSAKRRREHLLRASGRFSRADRNGGPAGAGA